MDCCQGVVVSMRTGLQLLVLGVLCCSQLACTTSTASVAVAAPAPSTAAAVPDNGAWQITVTVEGGIAGVVQRFSASSSSNSLVVTDARRGLESIVTMTDGERRQLSQSVAARATGPDVDLPSASCNDCYHYEMTITTGQAAKPRRVSYDAGAMEESPDTQLIDRLILMGRNGIEQRPR
jgi:hypothetical protein